MDTPATSGQPASSPTETHLGRTQAILFLLMSVATSVALGVHRIMVERPNEARRSLQAQGLRRGGDLDAPYDEQGNVITDNLGMIIFGILAIIAIGTAVSGLGTKVINKITTELQL
jgi:hypothetical protein